MRCFDVFNGDADGIIALVQLRLAEPRNADLVTGVKRDIKLLEQVRAAAGDFITVLDISMRSNAGALQRILHAGAEVFYVDHHNSGDIPKANNLIAVIDTYPSICTSLLVDQALSGAYRAWAITAAFGDNLAVKATHLADKAGYDAGQIKLLKKLGELINYNAYGVSIDDLHIHPAKLFQTCVRYPTPFEFARAEARLLDRLEQGFKGDLAKAENSEVLAKGVYLLDNARWARRISGLWANRLATQNPEQAHAILTPMPEGNLRVSVRAPLSNPKDADTLCLNFKTGGGRASAAGINQLPKSELERFIKAFENAYKIS